MARVDEAAIKSTLDFLVKVVEAKEKGFKDSKLDERLHAAGLLLDWAASHNGAIASGEIVTPDQT